jgi:hypothetical protein
LVAAGKATPAEAGSGILDEAPRDYGVDASSALADMRADER